MVVGDTVGSYKLVQKLGEGGMGVVYLAEHKYIARRAAIKFLLPDLTGSAEVVGRFFAEARAVSLIEHPGIVEVIDCELRSDGRAYIVMEHLQGESLRAYLERVGKLDGDPAGALAILRQIASALAAAHAQGIVHRDLKPDNVFLHLPTGRSPAEPIVKILDFGIAKLLGGDEERTSKTRTGQLLGTPLYMSPEQCRGARSVDGLSDVYSLGCIMYELYCGRPPFQAEGFGDLIIAHVSLAPAEPLDLAPSMAPLVRRTLLACLAKDPRGRPPSMEHLASMLSEAGAPKAIALLRPIDPGAPLGPFVGSSGARSPVPAAEPRRPAAPAIPAPAAVAQTLAKSAVVTPAGVGKAPVSTAKFTTLGEAASQLVEAPARNSRTRAVVVGLIGGLTLASVGVMLTSRGRATAPTPTSQPATPVAQPAAPSASAAPVTPSAAPETASVDLTDLPPGAHVRMDGQVATLPLLVPRGTRSHAVVVDADGFEPLQLSVDGARDRSISVEMKKKVASVPAPPPAAEQSAVKSHHRSEHRHGSPTFKSFTDL